MVSDGVVPAEGHVTNLHARHFCLLYRFAFLCNRKKPRIMILLLGKMKIMYLVLCVFNRACVVQFTALPLNTVVKPQAQASFEYSFMPAQPMAGRPFGLVILLNYISAEVGINWLFKIYVVLRINKILQVVSKSLLRIDFICFS